MSFTAGAVEKAELILCFERDSFGDLRDGIRDGKGPETKLLPWAFVRFQGLEEDRYVMPLNSININDTISPVNATAEDNAGNDVWQRIYMEFMPNRPFPLEAFREASVNGPGDSTVPGPIAIHYFGGV